MQTAARVGLPSYLGGFFAAWTLVRWALITWGPPAGHAWFDAAAKILVWIVPAVAYIRVHERRQPLAYLKLDVLPGRYPLPALSASVGIVAWAWAARFLLSGHATLSHRSWDAWLALVVITPVAEELVFRGLILQKLLARHNGAHRSFAAANGIATLLFWLIHLPVWIIVQHLGRDTILLISPSILAVGWVTGYVFVRSGSLWTAIVVHALYNTFAL